MTNNMTKNATNPSKKKTPTRTTALLAAIGLSVGMPMAGIAPAASAMTQPEATPTAEEICASMTANVYQSVNPTSEASLLTRWSGEIAGAAARHGFTENEGVAFRASPTEKPGLVPVNRLYKKGQFMWLADRPESTEIADAVSEGFTDEGVDFYAAPVGVECGVDVELYANGTKRRAVVDPSAGEALIAAGWTLEETAFWAAPVTDEEPVIPPVVTPAPAPPVVPPVPAPGPAPVPQPDPSPTDTTFSIAVIPDTQQEVFANRPDGTNSRFSGRTEWLVGNTSRYDLRYVVHSGDIVNWDTPNHAQYEVASKGLQLLENAGLENSLAIGNHDTAAVGVGGSAADPRRTRQLVRDTTTFNTYFSAARNAGIDGTFEAGKVDNNFHTFSAGGVDWLVLTLELWPRTEAVAWARDVVEAHPTHNVIVNTHSYMNSNGSIAQNSDYGANSPQYVYDNLVKLYPNIKMVFSGHVGQAAAREDVGVNGNRIFSYLGAFHSGDTNPVRILEIDTEAGTLKSTIHAPSRSAVWTQYDRASKGLVVVR